MKSLNGFFSKPCFLKLPPELSQELFNQYSYIFFFFWKLPILSSYFALQSDLLLRYDFQSNSLTVHRSLDYLPNEQALGLQTVPLYWELRYLPAKLPRAPLPTRNCMRASENYAGNVNINAESIFLFLALDVWPLLLAVKSGLCIHSFALVGGRTTDADMNEIELTLTWFSLSVAFVLGGLVRFEAMEMKLFGFGWERRTRTGMVGLDGLNPLASGLGFEVGN